MSYRGRELTSGNYLKLDDIQSQFNGSTTTFNLTSGGSAFYPGSAFSLLVSLAGVVQEAISAYTINQNTITFASAPQASDDFFCVVLGTALGIGVPGEGTVSGSKLTEPFDYDDGMLYLDSASDRVGINSTAPRSSLDVRGNVIVAGVVTATTFSGSFTGALTGTATSTTNIPNLTGAITSSNTTTSLGSFTSANLATALTDETGSGSAVFSTSPTLVSPALGAASATSIIVSSGSTFTNGPVFIGAATSTGTASQPLQVTGGAYVSGSVGIGTTNPGATLNVVPTATSIAGLFSGTTSSDMVRITQLGTGNALVVEDSANPDSSPFVVTGTGSVGIGTTNPNTILHLQSNSPAIQFIENDAATNNRRWYYGVNSQELYWQALTDAGGGGGNMFKFTRSDQQIQTFEGVNGGVTWFKIDNPNQILQVTGGAYVSGNLGIGTTNPTVALQLSPTASISNVGSGITLAGTVGSALTVAQFVYANTNTSYLRIKAARNATGSDWSSASTKLVNVTDVTEQGYIEYNPNGSTYGMAFGQGGSEWARFLSSGNLGIGTTNPVGQLQVSSGPVIIGAATSTGTASQPLQVTGGAYVSGSVGIGTANPSYKLQVVGSFAATTKSFVIDHPTKPNYKLRYASLEGAENGVYVRGRTTENIIELPEYWTELVDKDSITVNLTPIGNKHIWIEEINNNKVYIDSNSDIDCFYTVFAERKDVEKLIVEIQEN